MNNKLPFVSIIIPVLNGERTIRACLSSILHSDYPEEQREIVVIDNGSTDRTAEIVKTFPVQYQLEARRGVSYARNRGIEASRGGILAFTDSDCVVSRRWLLEVVQGFEDGKNGGMEGETVDYPPVTPAEHYMARRRSYSRKARLVSPLSPYVITANVAFRREVFDKIGVFDPRFPSGEDVDFSWRFFQETNFELGYNPRAIIFHRHRSTVQGFFSQHVRVGRGIAMLHAKYSSRLPWSWQQELRAWGAVAIFAWMACRAAICHRSLNYKRADVYDYYFTFLRKLAVRIGFVYETLQVSQR
ncbi:MAG: glycosyltransferase [Ignavibacteriales bacterium]